MIKDTPLRRAHLAVSALIHSHNGLWRKIGELARNREYLIVENPFKKLQMQMDVIEKEIGVTNETQEVRTLISSLCPA